MSRESGLIVAINPRTTSSRVLIFDVQGRVVSSAHREGAQVFPRSGGVAHRPRGMLTSHQVTLTRRRPTPTWMRQ
jgi:glycerol kinase